MSFTVPSASPGESLGSKGTRLVCAQTHLASTQTHVREGLSLKDSRPIHGFIISLVSAHEERYSYILILDTLYYQTCVEPSPILQLPRKILTVSHLYLAWPLSQLKIVN